MYKKMVSCKVQDIQKIINMKTVAIGQFYTNSKPCLEWLYFYST